MNIIQRFQPYSWINEVDRFFDRNVLNPVAASGPRESLHESSDAWILRLDLPGFTKTDLTLTVTDRVLQLVAETPNDRPFGGKVERQWKLGGDVNVSSIEARLENGVLELKLPKTPEADRQPVTIQIN